MRNMDITPGTLDKPKKFGLFDAWTGTWLGTTEAPSTYDDREIAQIAAQTMAVRLQVPPTQIKVQPFTSADTRVENIKPAISAEEALKKLCEDDA